MKYFLFLFLLFVLFSYSIPQRVRIELMFYDNGKKTYSTKTDGYSMNGCRIKFKPYGHKTLFYDSVSIKLIKE